MASVLELSKMLLSSAVQKIPKRPCSAISPRLAGQFKNSHKGNKEEQDGIGEMKVEPASARLVRSEEMINVGSLASLMSGASTSGMHWRSLFSPNLQQVRLQSTDAACIPKKGRPMEGPLPCVKTTGRLKKPCEVPKQKNWPGPCPSICLPCCEKVEKPLSCELIDIKLNSCPRKTYRIASYSECNKLESRKRRIKECCYQKQACHANVSLAKLEIQPLMSIKDRQALKLGYYAKTPEEPWGS